jgi:hypothetical protein
VWVYWKNYCELNGFLTNTDFLHAQWGRGLSLGASLISLIYSDLHLSFEEQSVWPDIPHLSLHGMSGCAPRIPRWHRGNHGSLLKQEKHLYFIPALKSEAFSCNFLCLLSKQQLS